MHEHRSFPVSLVAVALLWLAGCQDSTELQPKTVVTGVAGPSVGAVQHKCTGELGDDGSACDDGDPCTAVDSCQAGECKGDRVGLTYGGDKPDEALAIARLADGGFALAGYTASVGAGLTDGWLVRVDGQGKPLWNHAFGGAQSDQAHALLALADGFIVAGFRNAGVDLAGAQMWLVRTDTQGAVLWEKGYGSTGKSWAEAIAIHPGGYALAGSVVLPGQAADASLASVDKDGKLLWQQPIGGTDDDGVHALATLVDGFALAGFKGMAGGKSDMWLVRTDAKGTVQWDKTYGGSGNEDASALTVLKDGFALAGFTQSKGKGQSDMWLVRTDTSGQMLWDTALGGPKLDGARGLVALADGGFALCGDTGGSAGGVSLSWLVQVDAAGNKGVERTYGEKAAESFTTAIIAVPGGGFALAGSVAAKPGQPYDMWLVHADAAFKSTCD